MPFGFDPVEAEKVVKEIPGIVKKVYVEVTVDWLKDGSMRPLSFTLDDDQEFKIDKILAGRKGNSLKIYAPGMRYYCQTGRRRYYLYYDGELWYVEK